jgi:hypothetical protein
MQPKFVSPLFVLAYLAASARATAVSDVNGSIDAIKGWTEALIQGITALPDSGGDLSQALASFMLSSFPSWSLIAFLLEHL